MKRDFAISIAMATYNGEKYIKEQIDSILCQINQMDEIIISDDGSNDKTIDIIKAYKDKRIKIIDGPKQGVKQNFANALSNCKGKYIFLADQDDIWMNNKVEKVLKAFEENENSLCVLHDNITFNSLNGEILIDSFFKFRNSKKGIIRNVIKNSYIGCCMAIDSVILNKILPIPNDIEMHDQWIGIKCEMHGNSVFLHDKLIKYRRHENNVSKLKHNSYFKMIKKRIILVWRLFKNGRIRKN